MLLRSLAKSAFVDAPGGQRLFYPSGAWSRPYVVPNVVIENRLLTRHAWNWAIVLLVGISSLTAIAVSNMRDPTLFLAIVFAPPVLLIASSWFLLRPVVTGLERMARRPSASIFYRDLVRRRTYGLLLYSLASSTAFMLVFVASGVTGFFHPLIAIVGILIFAPVIASSAYCILLKRRMEQTVPVKTA